MRYLHVHIPTTVLQAAIHREHSCPQYKEDFAIIGSTRHKCLLQSYGNIFPLIEDIINLGIDAKHSNEDQIAAFPVWIDKYSDRIGLFGGFDLNLLVLEKPEIVRQTVLTRGTQYRNSAKGYGLGSGNSIPGYIPVDGFMAMVEAVKEIRFNERSNN